MPFNFFEVYMKINKIIRFLAFAFVILFVISIFAIEILYEGGDVNRLSDKELTPEMVSKIARYSTIYEYLIVFLFALLGYAFVSTFKLLTSPLVGGKVYKVVLAVVLYISCIIISIRGYSVIINSDFLLNFSGKITEHAYKTVWPHISILIMLICAKAVERSIKKDISMLYENVRNTKNRYNNYDELKDILGEHSKKL